jgi:hypothetical protein
MSQRKTKRKPVTAEEFMNRLEQDPAYLAKLEAQRRLQESSRKEAALAAIPVLEELAQLGFHLNTVAELYNKKLNYKEAIPVLLHWLPLINNLDVKESIVRALSVKWAKPSAAKLLVQEYREVRDPTGSGIKWAIGNALAVVADDAALDDIIEFVKDKGHGRARQMLAVALGNMKDPRAADALITLLDDEEVAGHAIMGLGKLKARSARPLIEPFLNHEKTWIRKEAQKALARIDKSSQQN